MTSIWASRLSALFRMVIGVIGFFMNLRHNDSVALAVSPFKRAPATGGFCP